jgi:hypothetical protein
MQAVRKTAICAAAAFLIAALAGCHRGMVRLRVAPDEFRFAWRKPVTLEQLLPGADDLAYVIQPPIGYAMARQQPLDERLLAIKLRWNEAVEPIWDCFPQLRDDHNNARITLQEFDNRRRELHEAVEQLSGHKADLDKTVAAYGRAREDVGRLRYADGAMAEAARAVAQSQMKTAGDEADRIVKEARRLVGILAGQEPAGDIIAGTRPEPRS